MKTYIFGAGASRAENIPVTSELLPLALQQLPENEHVNNTKAFLEDVFYLDLNDLELYPSFEDVLNIVDASILQKIDISSKYNYEYLEKIRIDIIYCMAEIIRKKAPSQFDTFHHRFIKNLFIRDDDNNVDYAFINLNYDILLDNALIYLFRANNEHGIDLDINYNINFRNSIPYDDSTAVSVDEDSEYWHEPRLDKSIYLLKPHGSLNWIYCPNCQTIKITPKRKSAPVIIDEPTPCEEDNSIQQPLIMAPTWYKSYSNPNIINIWMKCGEILRNSDDIIFIGYSLPEADHELRYLFKKNLYRNSRIEKPSIYLITKSDYLNDIKIRYMSLFGKEVKINNDGFEKFAENPNLRETVFI